GDTLRILEFDAGTAGCVLPTAESIEARLYDAGQRLLLYVNAAALDNHAGLAEALSFSTSAEAAPLVAGQGFFALTETITAANQMILADRTTGRQFSLEVIAFSIPDNLFGQISVGGASTGADYIDTLTGAFTTAYPSIITNVTIEGQPAGVRRFCNGELDVLVTFEPLAGEAADNCAANNITPQTIELGRQATVVLANAASDYLTCLTAEQLATVWSARSVETITRWNQVNPEFPDAPMTLFVPDPGDLFGNILMLQVAGANDPYRIDGEVNADPLFRAAAVNNVEGAATFMSWPEYQAVVRDGQASPLPVAVDSGAGCVAPDETTIADGSYPLSQPLLLHVSRAALTRPELQSLLWYAMSDANYGLLLDNGLTGLAFGDLPDIRASLQTTYDEVAVEAAEAAAAAAAAEATPEITPEVTLEPPPGE
ncbi:MAG: hypothetical protein GYB67_06820, partial [Chloroflexi bacterium]|nr:hypothetical protein [Chloroflexota bacterium]